MGGVRLCLNYATTNVSNCRYTDSSEVVPHFAPQNLELHLVSDRTIQLVAEEANHHLSILLLSGVFVVPNHIEHDLFQSTQLPYIFLESRDVSVILEHADTAKSLMFFCCGSLHPPFKGLPTSEPDEVLCKVSQIRLGADLATR